MCEVLKINCLDPFQLFVLTVIDQGVTHSVLGNGLDLVKGVAHTALFVLQKEWCKLVMFQAEGMDFIKAAMEP